MVFVNVKVALELALVTIIIAVVIFLQLPGGRNCYKCGEAGHFARECPNQEEGEGGGRIRFQLLCEEEKNQTLTFAHAMRQHADRRPITFLQMTCILRLVILK